MTPGLPPAGTVAARDLFRLLAASLRRRGARRARAAIALIDVDGLTQTNVTHGARQGDAVLERLSNALVDALTPGVETAARWAGDQYVVLLPGAARSVALERTRRIVTDVNDRLRESEPTVTVSAGVAAHPADGRTNADLVDAARRALHDAKRHGRSRVCGSRAAPSVEL